MNPTPTPAQLDALDEELRAVRSRRNVARGLAAQEHNAALARQQQAEREHWADPDLLAQLATADAVLRAAEAERDALAGKLRQEFTATEKRNAAVEKQERGGRAGFDSLPHLLGVDHIGGRVAADARYQQAEALVAAARGRRNLLRRDADRSAGQQAYAASQVQREAKRRRAGPAGALDALRARLTGDPVEAFTTTDPRKGRTTR